jgi:hypothetical protein
VSAERLYRAFALYHSENPHIYVLFKRFVADAVAANKERISARFIIERVRWEVEVATRRSGDDGFKINNNFSAFYGRLYLRERPEHLPFFELRESVADEVLPVQAGAAA